MFKKGNKWAFKVGHKWRFKKGHKLNIGEASGNWKGENAKYRAIHQWVSKWKGSPTTCEKCGRTNLTKQQIHWANIDHRYRRVLDDYIRLCAKCHKKYDKKRRERSQGIIAKMISVVDKAISNMEKIIVENKKQLKKEWLNHAR